MKDVDSYIPLFCVCAAGKKMGRKAPSSPVVVLYSAFILVFFFFYLSSMSFLGLCNLNV